MRIAKCLKTELFGIKKIIISSLIGQSIDYPKLVGITRGMVQEYCRPNFYYDNLINGQGQI